MNTRFTKVSLLVIVTGIFGSSSAMAQSYLDGSSKARGDYGQMSRSTGPMYRSAPSRSYSYEPSQAQPTPTTNGCGCGTANSSTSASNQPASPQGNVAQRGTQTYRAYSYEQEPSSGTMRSRSNSRPLYELPKTDSRRFGGQ